MLLLICTDLYYIKLMFFSVFQYLHRPVFSHMKYTRTISADNFRAPQFFEYEMRSTIFCYVPFENEMCSTILSTGRNRRVKAEYTRSRLQWYIRRGKKYFN